MEAARLCELLGRTGDSLKNAERGLKLAEDCLGVDHPIYLEALDKVSTMQRSSRI